MNPALAWQCHSRVVRCTTCVQHCEQYLDSMSPIVRNQNPSLLLVFADRSLLHDMLPQEQPSLMITWRREDTGHVAGIRILAIVFAGTPHFACVLRLSTA